MLIPVPERNPRPDKIVIRDRVTRKVAEGYARNLDSTVGKRIIPESSPARVVHRKASRDKAVARDQGIVGRG